MKRFIAILLALSLTTLAACSIEQPANTPHTASSPSATVDSRPETLSGVDLLIFNNENVHLSATPIQIDFNNMELYAGEAVFKLSSDSEPYDVIEPIYMTDSLLVLPSEPLETDFNGDVVTDDATAQRFYYDDYTMNYSGEAGTFAVYQGNQLVAENLPLSSNGYAVIPASFFIDEDGRIIILGYYIGDMMSTNVVSLIYSNDDEEWILENQHPYPNEWNEFGGQLSIAQPIERNTSCSAELNGFLLNEGQNLFLISPYEGTAKKVISEETIEEVLPYLDTHRESYSFFYDFGYQEGHYIATFQTYNALPGMYAVFFSESGEYEGYLLCNENGVTLFDDTNQAVSSLDMTNLLPLLYIPDSQI